jgi:transposase
VGCRRVELFEAIRRDHRREDLSIRALALRHGVHRKTVRAALASAVPAPRKVPERRSPRLEPFKETIDAMLREDLGAPRKQRHTARRVLARLFDEHAATAVTYSTVRDYVSLRRPQILAEAGLASETAFVLQTHGPGAEAEVDFGEVWVDLAGTRTKCYLFTLRLSHSGKAVHRVYASQGQEAFIEGHLASFAVLGGVPFSHIRYDNLTAAVSRVLRGRDRVESERWVAFRSHYGFDPFYCNPGIDGAHEKGGVEGEVGRFRRNHLVPVPVVGSLAELNGRLERADETDEARRIENRARTVGQDFATERPLLRALPTDAIDAGLWLTPRVDRYARVMVRQCYYSVPVKLIGRPVRVSLRANDLAIYDGKTVIACHDRLVAKGAQSLTLDHYLEVLARKPGALPGATALVHARACGSFTAAHEAFWAAARKTLGDREGTKALIDVLLLHRHLAHPDVVAGLTAAATLGVVSADVVAVEARKAATARGVGTIATTNTGTDTDLDGPRVVSLTQRRLGDPAAVIAVLPPDSRPVPSVAVYDELLQRRPAPPAEQDTATAVSSEGHAS